MRGKRLVSSRKSRGLLGGVLALLLVIIGLSYHYAQAHGSLMPLAQKIVPFSSDSRTAASKIVDTQAAAPTVPNSSSDNNNSAGATTTQPSSNIKPKMDQILDSSDDITANNCDDKMAASVNDYNSNVQKKKDDLISSIKFPPVPLNISSDYVKSYNDDITELFNSYLSAANDEHCTWPLKSPDTLPLNFTGQ